MGLLANERVVKKGLVEKKEWSPIRCFVAADLNEGNDVLADQPSNVLRSNIMSLGTALDGLIKSSNFWNLVFLVLGFALNQGWQWLEQIHRRREILAASRSELIALRGQLKDKADIVAQILHALDCGRTLPANSVRAMDLVYRNFVVELQLKLSPIERACLHVIYERIRILDYELEQFESSYASLAHVKGDDLASEYHAVRLRDLLGLCEKTDSLIDKYLLGNPPKVFDN